MFRFNTDPSTSRSGETSPTGNQLPLVPAVQPAGAGHPVRAPQRSEALDAIRGVAILQVVFLHCFSAYVVVRMPALGPLASLMWTGVDLFFVLSGFLIGGILIDSRASAQYFSTFYGRRFFRIAPLYGVTLVLLFLVPHLIFGVDVGRPWPYLTFTQNFVWASEGAWGHRWIGITWSLAVEEQFYLVLPVLVRYLSPRWLPWAFLVLIGLAPLARWLAVDVIYGHPHAAYLLMPCRMDALFLGALAAWLVRQTDLSRMLRENRSSLYGTAALLALVLSFFVATGSTENIAPPMWRWGYTAVALFHFTVLLLVVTRPTTKVPSVLRPLCWFGVGAYSIYLIHTPMTFLMNKVMTSETVSNGVAALATMLLAYLSWRFFEAPWIRVGHRLFPAMGRPAGSGAGR